MDLAALTSAPPVKAPEDRDNIPNLQLGNFPHYDVHDVRLYRYPLYALLLSRRGDPPVIAVCRANLLMFAVMIDALRWRPNGLLLALGSEVEKVERAKARPVPVDADGVELAPWERE